MGSGVPLSFPLSRSSESVGNNTRAADGVTGVTGVAILIKTRPDTIKSTHDSKSQRASAWRTVSSQLHGNARWKAAGIAPSPQILPAAPRCPHSSPAPRLPLCSLCRAAPGPSACAGCREHMGTGRQGSWMLALLIFHLIVNQSYWLWSLAIIASSPGNYGPRGLHLFVGRGCEGGECVLASKWGCPASSARWGWAPLSEGNSLAAEEARCAFWVERCSQRNTQFSCHIKKKKKKMTRKEGSWSAKHRNGHVLRLQDKLLIKTP